VSPKKQQVYQLKVTLMGVRPPIWRRFQVAGGMTLAELHQVLQIVMGWGNEHLYGFIIQGQPYSPPDEEMDLPEGWDAEVVTLRAAAPQAKLKFTYVYDFGDDWRHQVLVERIEPRLDSIPLPVCMAGKRACPPEDCGSISGYAEVVEAMTNQSHRRHKELLEWLGGPFDPEAFDLEAVNEALRDLRSLDP
jgi:hypothetical protein